MSNLNNKSVRMDAFYNSCSILAQTINNKRHAIHELLAPFETSEVIDHEIKTSIDALKNVRVEYDGFEQPDKKITASCFLPVNMPLYSLILYAVLPSYYFETIYLRPGASLSKYVPALIKALELVKIFSAIKVKDIPAKLFTDLYAKDSEVVIFTGKYENALMLEKECSDSMLIFEGTGPCPFFVFENADVELAAEKAVAMRCFNSGQDCVAPDVIFIHKSQADNFTKRLISSLKDIKVGDSKDPSVRVAQVVKEKYLFSVEKWLESKHRDIIFGGEVDTKQLIIHPTVIKQDIQEHSGTFMELFSPVFYLLSYEDNQSLLKKINASSFKERAMYASIFGDNKAITKSLSLYTIIKNLTVNDQEDGNKPYGGYGSIANFISYKGKRKVRPLLISRDIREWMLAHQTSNLSEHALQIT